MRELSFPACVACRRSIKHTNKRLTGPDIVLDVSSVGINRNKAENH